MNLTKNFPTNEILNDETWEEDILKNYLEEQEPTQTFEMPDLEELKEIIEELKRPLKSKQELRSHIDDLEDFIVTKALHLLNVFKPFKNAFINSWPNDTQSTLDSYIFRIANWFNN